MRDHSEQLLDRFGAVAGFAAVALLLAIVIALPALPGPDEPIGQISAAARDDATNLLWGSYVGTLMTICLLTFGATIAAALRRAENAGGGWWLLALAGIAATSIGIIGNAAVATFVRAVEHGASGEALWIGYGLDHALGVLLAAPLGLFVLASSIGAKTAGLLPRWLTWTGIVGGPLLLVGAGSIAGDELEGGVLGLPLVLGYLVLLVWIVASSVSLWRGPRRAHSPAGRAVDVAT